MIWTLGWQRWKKCPVQKKKVFRCPWAEGGRREGGREEVLGTLQGGKPVFLGLGFVVLGFMPLQNKKRGVCCLQPGETPLMGESSLAHK